jgi:hypothetical protein
MIRASIQEQTPPDPAKASAISMQAGVLSLSGLSPKSLLDDTTAFNESLPYISVTFVAPPLLEGRAGSLAPRVGVGVEGLSRTGALSVPGSDQRVEQKAFLFPGEIGLEGRPAFLQGKQAALHLDGSAVPVLLVTQPSPLGDAQSTFGIAGRAALSGEYALSGRLPNDDLRAEVTLLGTLGSTASELKLNGVGVQAGIRLKM